MIRFCHPAARQSEPLTLVKLVCRSTSYFQHSLKFTHTIFQRFAAREEGFARESATRGRACRLSRELAPPRNRGRDVPGGVRRAACDPTPRLPASTQPWAQGCAP